MTLKRNSKLFLVLFLGTLSAFGPFVTDLYLPALPTMTSFFNASTSTIQLTLTGSMVGLALGQLLIGPISDKYGRKNPLIISLVIYLVSTLAIIIFPNVYAMIVLRFIQGVSSAGAVVISRAISTDLYQGRELAAFFALLMASTYTFSYIRESITSTYRLERNFRYTCSDRGDFISCKL